jgi:hypothetical protein
MSAGGDARSSQKAMASDLAAKPGWRLLATWDDTRRVAVGARANEHQPARGWLSPVSFTGAGSVGIAAARRRTV